MPIFDIYSRRLRQEKGCQFPDILEYTTLPEELRYQILHIIEDATITEMVNPAKVHSKYSSYWSTICKILTREWGAQAVYHGTPFNHLQIREAILKFKDVAMVLDVIELTFSVLPVLQGQFGYHDNPEITAAEAVEELNDRFKEHGIGYQFVEGRIIRVDSTYLHAEVTLPALALLHDAEFKGASDEFLRAHEHHRSGANREAMADALKSLESVLKTICDRVGWEYSENATAFPLIDLVLKKGLVPAYLSTEMNGLRSALESTATVRNRTKGVGHGQGSEALNVPSSLASFALHITAANIVFLLDCYDEKMRTLK